MSLLSMYYDLLFITVSVRFVVVSGMDETTQTKNDKIETLVRLQKLDRGNFAKPKIDIGILRSMSLDALDKLVQEAHVELKCSYLYFAMLHLHIIETYMTNPINLTNLSDKEIDSIICTEESATILALVHDQDGEGWKDIRSVMWIFHMFAEKTANFLRPLGTEVQVVDKKYVVSAYKSVKILLGEFALTNGCKAYNPVNRTLEDYTYSLENTVISGRLSTIQQALKNKERFRRLIEHNAQWGWVAHDTYRFSIDHLHINNILYNEQIMIDLLTFGLPVCWQPIVTMVKNLHVETVNSKIFLNEYIQALGHFQLEYIRMLGSVAIQVVVKQLQYLNMIGRICNNIGIEIAEQLSLFAKHVRLVNDQVFSRVIDSTKNMAFNVFHMIEYHINILLRDLNEMYPVVDFGVNFRMEKPESMAEDDFIQQNKRYIKNAANAIIVISKVNQLTIDFTVVNRVLVQVFVEYIKQITLSIDFGIIDSFKQMTASSILGRFTEIEKVNK